MIPEVVGLALLAGFAGVGLGASLFHTNITPAARWFSAGFCALTIALCLYAAWGLSHGP